MAEEPKPIKAGEKVSIRVEGGKELKAEVLEPNWKGKGTVEVKLSDGTTRIVHHWQLIREEQPEQAKAIREAAPPETPALHTITDTVDGDATNARAEQVKADPKSK